MTQTERTISHPVPNNRRWMIALYGAAVFLYWMSLYLYVPTLPTYAESKSDNLALVGIILAQYGLWQGIIRFPLGIAADWLGRRKPFIIVGFALCGLGAVIMGAANGASGLVVGRAITGLAAGTWVPLIAVFSGLFPPREAVKATAILSMVGSVGRVLATITTGSLNEWGGYPLAFFVAGGIAALAILILLPAQENRRPPQRPTIMGIGQLISRQDVFLPALLAAVSQYANWAATFSFVPILAQRLGATDITQSTLMSMHIGIVILGNLLITPIVNRIGARRLVYLSFVLLSVGIGGMAFVPSLVLLFAFQFCIGLSQGIGYSALMGMSIEHVADANRATAMGLHQAVYSIGMFTGPWLSGILADAMGIRSMFGLTAFVCLVSGLLVTRQLGTAS